MNYVEEQFQGLLETVALFEDIAAVAAAPMNGGVICDTAFGNIDGYFDNMFKVNRDKIFHDTYKNWRTESTMPIYSPMELMVVANDIRDLDNAGWLNTATNED